MAASVAFFTSTGAATTGVTSTGASTCGSASSCCFAFSYAFLYALSLDLQEANAEGLKDFLDAEGYNATIAFNAESAMYRVIVSTFADRTAAAQARDAFKAKYPNRKDFQGAWLLYRVF